MAWFQGKDKYLNTIKKRLEVHGTVYVDEKAKTKRSYMPSFVTNHGLQKPEDFHVLLRKSKVATVILKWKLYLIIVDFLKFKLKKEEKQIRD